MKRFINHATMFAAFALATFNLASCQENVAEEVPLPADAGTITGQTVVLEGQSITLEIASIEGAETYHWYTDGTKGQNTDSKTLTVTEAGTYKVAGVNQTGEGKASADHVVTMTFKPGVAGTISGPKTFVEGEEITLVIGTIEGAATYQWYKDGEKGQNTDSQTLTVTEAGTYTVAGVNAAGEGEASADHVVTSTPAPTVPSDAGAISGPTEVVEGESITLTIATIEGAETYQWYKDGAKGQNTASKTLTVTEGGTYKVAGVNAVGEGKASANHVVTWRPAPTVPATPGNITASKPNPVVTGETVTLSIADVEGAETYKWYRNDNAIAGQTGKTIAVTEAAVYKVSGVNNVGEGAKSSGYEVVFIPAAAGTITADKANPVPAGESVTLSIAEIPGATNYRWFLNDVEKMTSTLRTYTVNTAGVYTVAGVNASGVGAKSAAYTLEYAAAPIPGAPGTLTANFPNPYQGQSVTLTIGAIANAVKYRWYRNGIMSRENTMLTWTGITSGGTYAVSGLNSEGVEGPKSPDYVVAFLPANAGTITTNNANPTTGQTVTLTAPTISGSTSYKWYKDDVVMAGQTAQTLAVTESGTYKVAGVNATGEGAKSAGLVVTFTAAGNEFVDDLVGTWRVSQWVRSGSSWTKDERNMTISKNTNGTINITGIVSMSYGTLNMDGVTVDNTAKTIKFPTNAALTGSPMGTMTAIPFKTDGGAGDVSVEFPAMSFTEVGGTMTLNMYTYGTVDTVANGGSSDPMTGTFAVCYLQGSSWMNTFAYVSNSVWTKVE
jgi:hypothetical protein